MVARADVKRKGMQENDAQEQTSTGREGGRRGVCRVNGERKGCGMRHV